MRIGIAGPIDLSMLKQLFPQGTAFPATWSFPLIATLAAELHKRGHEIVIFALSRQVVATQVFAGDRIQVYICPQRRPRRQMADFFKGERQALCRAIQQSKCDVVHAHWAYEFGAATVDSGVPHVVTAHDIPLVVLRFARHPYWLLKPLLAWRVLRTAKVVTAVSPYTADSLNGFLRPQRDIAVVSNGVTADVFALHVKRRPTRQPGKIVFASILNSWAGRKNGQQLVKAFAILRKRLGNKVELWMIGDGHENDGLGAMWARKRSLEPGIRFLGPLPHGQVLSTLVEKVDVLVHPSLEETHGMVITEAMAVGIPVIGGRSSGAVPWVLGGGKAGMLVDVSSKRSLTSAMHTMATEPSLRESLASAGREAAMSRFHIDSTVDRYEALLAEQVQ